MEERAEEEESIPPLQTGGTEGGRSERTTTPAERKDRRKVFIIPLGDESGFYQVAAEVLS